MEESKENKSPEWLDSNFLCKAMRSYKKDNSIELVNFKVESGFGEHFGSKMLRSRIEFKSKKYQNNENEIVNAVIKIDPAGDGNLEHIVEDGPLFETETDVYENVIPKMHALYERNGIDVKFAPK
jgi:Ecdysteroid kinase-like family